MSKLPVEPKASRSANPAASPDAHAGAQGIALAPPAYGIGMADNQPPQMDGAAIQRRETPATTRDSAHGIPHPNRTGLPDALKSGIEALSGLALDDVRVRFVNSPRPAQFQALAYTQGSAIHVAPGQERHLPHEAWHVVQQKQGRVRATIQLAGEQINDDAGLEHEADLMGTRALQLNEAIHDLNRASIAPAQDHILAAVQRAAPARISAPIPAGGSSYKLVAGEGGRQIGSVMVHANDKALIEVTDLGVDQAHRAQGIGKMLIASAARTGLQLGKARMALAAQDEGSGRLTQWYKRMGFAQVGVHPSGYLRLEAPIARVLGGVVQGRMLLRAAVPHAQPAKGAVSRFSMPTAAAQQKMLRRTVVGSTTIGIAQIGRMIQPRLASTIRKSLFLPLSGPVGARSSVIQHMKADPNESSFTPTSQRPVAISDEREPLDVSRKLCNAVVLWDGTTNTMHYQGNAVSHVCDAIRALAATDSSLVRRVLKQVSEEITNDKLRIVAVPSSHLLALNSNANGFYDKSGFRGPSNSVYVASECITINNVLLHEFTHVALTRKNKNDSRPYPTDAPEDQIASFKAALVEWEKEAAMITERNVPFLSYKGGPTSAKMIPVAQHVCLILKRLGTYSMDNVQMQEIGSHFAELYFYMRNAIPMTDEEAFKALADLLPKTTKLFKEKFSEL